MVSRFYSQDISRIYFSSKTVAVPIQTFINSNFQAVVTQHLHLLQGESHVSRGAILLLGNITYAPCHISLNVRIKSKKKKSTI